MVRASTLAFLVCLVGWAMVPAWGQPAPLPADAAAAPVEAAPTTPPIALPTGPIESFEDRNGTLLRQDVLVNPPGWRRGWFAGVEGAVLKPHIENHLFAPVAFTPTITSTVYAPFAELDWTGAPRVELGYRFDQAFGEVRLAYQSIVSDGTATIEKYDFFGDGTLKSRLNVNTVDLSYSTGLLPYGMSLAGVEPWGYARWDIGARLLTAYTDTRAQGYMLGQRVSNNFVGAGPFSALEHHTPLGDRFSLYARVQGAVAIGETRQGYEETYRIPGILDVGAATTVNETNAVPIVDVQAGLSWAPQWSPHGLRFTFGYQFQGWWYLGQTFSEADAHLTAQGMFLRGEWGF